MPTQEMANAGAVAGGGPVPPAPGGTLAQYSEYLTALGRAHYTSAGGKQLWTPGSMRGELKRVPSSCTDPVDPAEARRLLKQRGVRVLNYLLSADVPGGPNCFLYLCRDPQYHLDRLHKNSRKVIKRGLRNFEVRRCSWEEIEAKGLAAKRETDLRHGYQPTTPESFQTMLDRWRGSRFHEAWGAWRDGDLAAWVTLYKVDDWAEYEVAPSRTDFMSLAPNNVVRYVSLRTLLVEEKWPLVMTGLSSVNPSLSMHQYNTRIGFEAAARRRVFVPHPLLTPMLKPRWAYPLWKRLAAALPQIVLLQKVSGLARLMSSREENALAWADPQAAAGESEEDAEA